MNKKHTKLILALFILLILVVFFFPKARVIGGLRGFIGANEVSYREEYDCIGIENNFCPDWPDYGCDLQCYGLVVNKQCYNQSIGSKTKTECRT